MTDQIRCMSYNVCRKACDLKTPFDPMFGKIVRECFVRMAAEPEMMICPRAQDCISRHCALTYNHATSHPRDSSCDVVAPRCPACVPVEQPEPKPQPVDLDEARQWAKKLSFFDDSSSFIHRLADEIERLRSAHTNILADLELCQGEVDRLGQGRDALDLRLSASRRLAKSYIGLWRRTLEERDELSREVDRLRDWYWALAGERDKVRELSNWRYAKIKELRALVDRAHDKRDELRRELHSKRAQIVGYNAIIEDIATAATGSSEWREPGSHAVIDAVRKLVGQRDALRLELEVMTRVNAQLGGLVREAQADTVMVGEEVAE